MIRLNIFQQPAKLELSITDPVLNIRTTSPKTQLSTQPAIVEIRRTEGKLELDFTPYRYSIGFKNNADFMRDFANEGKQAALEAVARIAQEGDRLARIESKEDAIVQMAIESNFPEPPDITWARIEPPIIHYEPGKVDFNVIRGKVDLNLQRGTVELNLQRGEVKGRITQYPSIRFWTTNNEVDMSV